MVYKLKKVLTIAGSDSGGGAGIQADIKTFASRGVYGLSVLTSLTAQNTIGMQNILEIEPNFIKEQIDSVMMDIGAEVWKTGMLSNSKIIEIVVERAKFYNIKFLVVDPVMIAKSGDFLLKKESIETIIKRLIPISYVITPNRYEAQILSNIMINKIEDACDAAKIIYKLGTKNVIIKRAIDATDIFYNGKITCEYNTPLIYTNNNHGTGCTFASVIAAELAKGKEIIEAIQIAKAYLFSAISNSINFNIGKGQGPINHFYGEESKINLFNVKVRCTS